MPWRKKRPSAGQAVRTAWALQLARIYDVFPLTCPKCRGTMRHEGAAKLNRGSTLVVRNIAFINEGEAIREIRLHRGEPITPPQTGPGP